MLVIRLNPIEKLSENIKNQELNDDYTQRHLIKSWNSGDVNLSSKEKLQVVDQGLYVYLLEEEWLKVISQDFRTSSTLHFNFIKIQHRPETSQQKSNKLVLENFKHLIKIYYSQILEEFNLKESKKEETYLLILIKQTDPKDFDRKGISTSAVSIQSHWRKSRIRYS